LLPRTPDAEIEAFMHGIEVDEELDAARRQLSLPRPENSALPDPVDPK
jgi:hypothetical protein